MCLSFLWQSENAWKGISYRRSNVRNLCWCRCGWRPFHLIQRREKGLLSATEWCWQRRKMKYVDLNTMEKWFSKAVLMLWGRGAQPVQMRFAICKATRLGSYKERLADGVIEHYTVVYFPSVMVPGWCKRDCPLPLFDFLPSICEQATEAQGRTIVRRLRKRIEIYRPV